MQHDGAGRSSAGHTAEEATELIAVVRRHANFRHLARQFRALHRPRII
jgi:short-subunit dehydrogenase